MDEGWEPVPADLLDSTDTAKELPHANGHASPAPEPDADVEEVKAAGIHLQLKQMRGLALCALQYLFWYFWN